MTRLSVGVVIPTVGATSQLQRLLISLQTQSQPPEVTVVVAGATANGVVELAKRFGCLVIRDPVSGDRRSYARNLGAASARTQIIAFLDDDMEASDTLIEECSTLAKSGAVAIVVPEVTRGSGILGKVRAWERSLVESDVRLCFPRVIRRDTFLSTGGFDETMSGFEDLDITATLIEKRTPITRATSHLIHHEESMTLRAYLIKRKRYVRNAKAYGAKHPSIAMQVLSPVKRLQMYLAGVQSPSDLLYMVIGLCIRIVEASRVEVGFSTARSRHAGE